MMKILRVAMILCLLAAATVSALPARANHTYVPPIDRSPVPDLAGDTTVIGDKTGWMRVRLPEPIHTEKIDWIDLSIKGHGRLFGALLVREVNGEIERRPPSIDFLQSGMCNKAGCKPKKWAMTTSGANAKNGILEAGIYRLYVLADGGPVEVHFSTPELPGVVRLNPTRKPAGVKVHSLTPRVTAGPTGMIYSAGDKRPFRGPGFAFQAQWVDPAGAGLIDRDVCWYDKEAPEDQTTAYMPPACPLDVWWHLLLFPSGYIYSPTFYSDGCCWEMHFASSRLPKAMGSWYALTSPADHYGAAALWLKLD